MNEIIESCKGGGGTGRGYSRLKAAWTLVIKGLAKRELQPVNGPVRVDYLWVEPHRRRDKDNVAAAQKFVFDGLKAAGIIANDGWSQILRFEHDFAVNEEKPGVMVTITEELPNG